MNREGTLDKFDVAPSLVADELREIVNSEDGLWFVSRFLIGNTRLSERSHKPLLRWLQRQVATPNNTAAERDPRASGKTDGGTIALPLWMVAADAIPNTPCQSFNSRIVIVAPKKELASNIFLSNIERRFQGCQAYRDLFPWLQPDPKFWSLKNGLLLKRTLIHGQPTIMPLGMESVSTSLHPPLLIVDDPITEQNYRSHAEVRKIREWVEHSHALTSPVNGSRIFLGNFWAVGDVQDLFHPDREDCPKEWKRVNVWERGITGCATCVDGAPIVYPGGGSIAGRHPDHQHEGERFPIGLLKEKKDEDSPDEEEDVSIISEIADSIPSFIYLTQRENILIDSANLAIDMKWIKYYHWKFDQNADPMLMVPQFSKKALEAEQENDPNFQRAGKELYEIITLDQLDFWLLIDPAPSEEASRTHARFAAAVVATEKIGTRIFLIDEHAKNQAAHLNINAVLDLYEKWRERIRKIGCESVGYQSTIKDSLLQAAIARGIPLRESQVEQIPRLRSEGAQNDRILHALVPMMELGNFHVRRDHRIFREEAEKFGLAGAKHDLLDAISNLTRVRPTRKNKAKQEMYNAARRRREEAGKTGGY